MANQRNCALPELIAEAIHKLAVAEPPQDSILEMFADRPATSRRSYEGSGSTPVKLKIWTNTMLE
jgi:hypothetical protein